MCLSLPPRDRRTMGAPVVLNVCTACGAYVADELGHARWHRLQDDARDAMLAVLDPLVRDLERRAAEVEEAAT